MKAIVNISRRKLTTSEESERNKGLNFDTTINQIPYLNLIDPVEEVAMKIPKNQADELIWKARWELEKLKPPKPDILKEERRVVKILQCDENIVTQPADKGNGTEVIDKVNTSNYQI